VGSTIQDIKKSQQLQQKVNFEGSHLKQTPNEVVSEFRRAGHLVNERSIK